MGSPEGAADAGLDLVRLNERFETATPQEILAWTVEAFAPNAVLTMSFQHEGVVIAHLLRTIAPETPILFIDTGYHFPETLAYRDELVARFGFPIRNLTAAMAREDFLARHGNDLYNRDPDLCCKINKVDPMQLALVGVRAWINGRRRDQAVTRRAMPIAERLQGGIVKVNPLANWTSRDTYRYLAEHDIPTHPLFEQGYTSIGCWPCTRPVLAGEDERAGRWSGRGKVECGLHTFLESSAPPDAAGDEPGGSAPPEPASAAPDDARATGEGKRGRRAKRDEPVRVGRSVEAPASRTARGER